MLKNTARMTNILLTPHRITTPGIFIDVYKHLSIYYIEYRGAITLPLCEQCRAYLRIANARFFLQYPLSFLCYVQDEDSENITSINMW